MFKFIAGLWVHPVTWTIDLVKWLALPVRRYPWHATIASAIIGAICIANYDPASPHRHFVFYAGPVAFALAAIKPFSWFLQKLQDEDPLHLY